MRRVIEEVACCCPTNHDTDRPLHIECTLYIMCFSCFARRHQWTVPLGFYRAHIFYLQRCPQRWIGFSYTEFARYDCTLLFSYRLKNGYIPGCEYAKPLLIVCEPLRADII
jgi:hypothetical protein